MTTDTLVIRPGAKNGYYTVWLASPAYVKGVPTIEYQYLKNLPRTLEKAIASAEKLAAEMSVAFKAPSELPALQDFDRNAPAEVPAPAAQTTPEPEFEIDTSEWWASKHAQLAQGILPLGIYAGTPIGEAPREWLTWYARDANFSKLSTLSDELDLALATRQVLLKDWDARLLPIPNPDTYLGQPGQRVTVWATVLKTWSGIVSGYNGEDAWAGITTLVDNDGNCLSIKSGAWKQPKVGEAVQIVGTVTKHSEYKGLAQTSLNRVKTLAAV